MKFKDRPEYADFFAGEAIRRLGRQIVSWDPDGLVPVPLHPSKKRRRGYNQAELLAKRIGERLDIPVRPGAVRRVRRTVPMKSLSAASRAVNLTGAIAPGETAGLRRAVIIDDIYTTGATAEAVASVLKNAGVGKVFVVTMAAGSDAGSETSFLTKKNKNP